MFKKLKDKIAEEVKSSPQRIQQIAQAVVSSASSTSSEVSGNDTFFSIAEEDTPQNSPQHITNSNSNNSLSSITNTVSSTKTPILNDSTANNYTTNRNRKLSTSSVGSDVSFRLPSYDSPAVYHLQSDLDMSASEVDSPSSIILDKVSKEQLHQAYRSAMDKHQKYRRRYADLAKKYGELERENSKARSVLVETQDKALRRISELREQCSLEQQAKAHLEAALRMELDDKDCLIQSLKTKLESEFDDSLMSISNKSIEDPNQQSMLIDLNSPNVSDSVDYTDQSENIQRLEKELEKLQEACKDYKVNYDAKVIEADHYKAIVKDLEVKFQQKCKEYDELKSSEEENALSIAECKQNMHKELERLQDLEKTFKDNLNQEKLEWENMLRICQNDKKDTEGRLKILQSDLKKIEEEKQELAKALKLKDDKIADCLKELDDLKTSKAQSDTQLSKNNKDLQELANKITSLDWSIKQLESERIALIQKCDLLVKENEVLTDTKEKLKHVSDTLLVEKQQLTQELLLSQQLLQDHVTSTQNMKKEIEILKSEKESTRCVNDGKVRDKLMEAEKACQNLQQDCSLLETEKANQLFELRNLCKSLLVLKSVVRNDESPEMNEDDSIKVSTLESHVLIILKDIKIKFKDFETKINDLSNQNVILEETKTKLQNDLNNTNKTQKNLEKLKKTLAERDTKLQEVQNKSQKDIENLQSELKVKSEYSDKLQKDLKLLSDSSAEVCEESRRLQQTKKQLEDLLHQKEQDIESFKLNNEDITERLHELVKVAGLEGSQNNAEALQDLRKRLVELEDKCKNYEDLQKENEELKQSLQDLEKDKEGSGKEFVSSIENLEKAVTKLKDDKVYLNKLLSNLEEKNAGKDEEIQKLRKEMESLQVLIQDQTVLQDRITELENASRSQKEELLEKLSAENCQLQSRLEECTTSVSNIANIKTQYQALKKENDELTEKIKSLEEKYDNTERSIDSKISNLNQEIDCHIDRIKYLESKCEDYDSVKKINVELNKETQELTKRLSQMELSIGDQNQNKDVEDKLAHILKEVSEVSNKNLVLEQKCSNMSLLEQTNEKLKLANEKLSRQLDDTLVTRRHSESITQLTEFEYLRNILFQYLSGGVGNVGPNTTTTLVRVIAAVMKFDATQTQTVLDKEAQRNTLLGQLNLI